MVQGHFTVVDGKAGPVVVAAGELPDGNFVIGWAISEHEEVLTVAYSGGDGEGTLTATARCVFPRLTDEQKRLVEHAVGWAGRPNQPQGPTV